jgi:F-type H+-transporting ATPase subunit delta
MKGKILATKYVLALKHSLSDKEVKDALELLISMISYIVNDLKAWAFFKSPINPLKNKLDLIEKILDQLEAPTKVRSFLQLVLKKKKAWLLPVIVPIMQKELDDFLNIVDLEIKLPEVVDIKSEKELARIFQKFTDKEIRAKFIHDPEMLGGFIVKLGNTMYDGSLRNTLSKIKKSISEKH